MYEPIAEDRGIALLIQSPHELSVHGDRDLLIEGVTNPVDNAVRCTPEIDRILRKTITDPVGPEFMAPPSLGIAARRNTGSSCREQKNNCCSMIVVVRLSKTLDLTTIPVRI